MDSVFPHVEALPIDDPILQEVSAVTDPGNLRAIFSNMKFFLETGTVPSSPAGQSSLPAVIFGIPAFQYFLSKEFANKISVEDVAEMSAEYLRLYEKRS